jgi:hypothetical protein
MLRNPLYAPDTRTPRERFWSEQKFWPDDTPEHVFVARSLLKVGAVICGPEWSDSDPAIAIPATLPDRLSIHTPMKDIVRATDLLALHVDEYRKRSWGGIMGAGADFPSRAEWELARKLNDQDITAANIRHNRYLRAAFAMDDQFKRRRAVLATRRYNGGDFTQQPWHFWNMEYAWTRFDTCRVDPQNIFGITSAEFDGLWIFVERKGNADDLAAAASKSASNTTDQQVEEKANTRPRARGRRVQFDWDEITAEFVRLFHTRGVADDANLSEISRELADWASAKWTDAPEPKTIQDKLRKWLARLREPPD